MLKYIQTRTQIQSVDKDRRFFLARTNIVCVTTPDTIIRLITSTIQFIRAVFEVIVNPRSFYNSRASKISTAPGVRNNLPAFASRDSSGFYSDSEWEYGTSSNLSGDVYCSDCDDDLMDTLEIEKAIKLEEDITIDAYQCEQDEDMRPLTERVHSLAHGSFLRDLVINNQRANATKLTIPTPSMSTANIDTLVPATLFNNPIFTTPASLLDRSGNLKLLSGGVMLGIPSKKKAKRRAYKQAESRELKTESDNTPVIVTTNQAGAAFAARQRRRAQAARR